MKPSRTPIPANSPGFEFVYVANQRCECGGYFATVSQSLQDAPARPTERVLARCEACGAERTFVFDISSFFGKFERYDRFQQTEDTFRRAMAALRAGRPTEAEVALREVVDPEKGEPAFAWGYYHLGRVLLMQGRAEEAVGALERAAAIQPLEPDIHRVLARALQAAGRVEQAQGHLRRAEELRARFG
ncbi:MAG TPA: tetratricopeptide repeat protein [Chloroflexi bacterium]|nr:tetratricopeptide repeat protein [Chloroflexota bacterium]